MSLNDPLNANIEKRETVELLINTLPHMDVAAKQDAIKIIVDHVKNVLNPVKTITSDPGLIIDIPVLREICKKDTARVKRITFQLEDKFVSLDNVTISYGRIMSYEHCSESK